MEILASLVFAVFVLVGCNEIGITQIVYPANLNVNTPEVQASVDTTAPTASTNSIQLAPDSIVMRIGSGVVVEVSVFDLSTGRELTSQERGTISYSFNDDPTAPVATVSKVDGRWLTFLGINAGKVNATITTAGASGILPIQVDP